MSHCIDGYFSNYVVLAWGRRICKVWFVEMVKRGGERFDEVRETGSERRKGGWEHLREEKEAAKTVAGY